jgi:pimeloyl-ACP methyl ester carboxylesterase
LARAGFAVAAFDFAGHGRNPVPLSPDVTRIEGTTAQLVAETVAVAQAMSARPETGAQVVLVGHSMATDVIIRAARDLGGVAAVAAISMYSEAITATEPKRLLVVSGEYEPHLREAGLNAVAQIDAQAGEGQTVAAGEVLRRTVFAPGVEHMGVLYSETTKAEITAWLTEAVGLDTRFAPDLSGTIAGLMLVALILLAWPASRFLPEIAAPPPQRDLKASALAVVFPIPALLGVVYLLPLGSFATLAAAFGTWGMVQLAALGQRGHVPAPPELIGLFAFLAVGSLFALALDRYGAAFLPVGPRLPVMALMLLGTVPLMLADSVLARVAPLWLRIVARAALVIALGGAMALSPTELGLTFTVLPVLVLFFVVYGSFARWVTQARGPGAAHLGMGLALAWAVAASTPLFAAA